MYIEIKEAIIGLTPGVNSILQPRYNSSVEKNYNATSSLARFVNKNSFSLKKHFSLHTMYNAGVVEINSEVVVLAPGLSNTVDIFQDTFVSTSSPAAASAFNA
jgi:hypothetical protein